MYLFIYLNPPTPHPPHTLLSSHTQRVMLVALMVAGFIDVNAFVPAL